MKFQNHTNLRYLGKLKPRKSTDRSIVDLIEL